MRKSVGRYYERYTRRYPEWETVSMDTMLTESMVNEAEAERTETSQYPKGKEISKITSSGERSEGSSPES